MLISVVLLVLTTVRGVEGVCYKNDLYRRLSVGCAEASSFCSSVLSTKVRRTVRTVYNLAAVRTTYKTPSTTETKSKTVLNYEIRTVYPTETLVSTVASTTITRSACSPTVTCGAATFTTSFGPLREACSCILQSTTTGTLDESSTRTYDHPVTYLTTVTHYDTSKPTKTSVIRSLITRTVATATAYTCDTLPAPTHQCNNKLQQYAEWSLRRGNKYANWTPEKYQSIEPRRNDTGYPGFSYFNSFEDAIEGYDLCYGRYVNARGYIYAPQTGYYNWTLAAVSNKVYLWLGDSAYRGYTISNAFLHSGKKVHGGGPSRLIHWKAGNYYPFRTAWLCASNPYDFYFHVQRPDGFVLYGQYSPNSGDIFPDFFETYDTPANYYGTAYYGTYHEYYERYEDYGNVTSNYQVQFGCGKDAKQAPNFPDWGREK